MVEKCKFKLIRDFKRTRVFNSLTDHSGKQKEHQCDLNFYRPNAKGTMYWRLLIHSTAPASLWPILSVWHLFLNEPQTVCSFVHKFNKYILVSILYTKNDVNHCNTRIQTKGASSLYSKSLQLILVFLKIKSAQEFPG